MDIKISCYLNVFGPSWKGTAETPVKKEKNC